MDYGLRQPAPAAKVAGDSWRRRVCVCVSSTEARKGRGEVRRDEADGRETAKSQHSERARGGGGSSSSIISISISRSRSSSHASQSPACVCVNLERHSRPSRLDRGEARASPPWGPRPRRQRQRQRQKPRRIESSSASLLLYRSPRERAKLSSAQSQQSLHTLPAQNLRTHPRTRSCADRLRSHLDRRAFALPPSTQTLALSPYTRDLGVRSFDVDCRYQPIPGHPGPSALNPISPRTHTDTHALTHTHGTGTRIHGHLYLPKPSSNRARYHR